MKAALGWAIFGIELFFSFLTHFVQQKTVDLVTAEKLHFPLGV